MSDEPSLEKKAAEQKPSSTVPFLRSPPGLPRPKIPFPGASIVHVENSDNHDNHDNEQSPFQRTGIRPFPPPEDSEDAQNRTAPATPRMGYVEWNGPPATPRMGHVQWNEPPQVDDDSQSLSSQTSIAPFRRYRPPIVPRIDCLTDLNWKDMSDFITSSKLRRPHVELTPDHYNSFLQTLIHFSNKFRPVLDLCPALHHLDWVADNPCDPEYRGSKLSAEDRAVYRHNTYLLQKAQRRIGEPAFVPPALHSHWNRILPYGHWINGENGSARVFLEIQVKRISGRDINVLHSVGVHHEYAFLGIRGRTRMDPAKMSPPSTAEADDFYAKTLKKHVHRYFSSSWFSGSQRGENEAAEAKLQARVNEDPMFRDRVKDSYIYLVRVVAIPDPNISLAVKKSLTVNNLAVHDLDDLDKHDIAGPTAQNRKASFAVNGLTGPAEQQRKASFCAMGGWLAPYTPSQCRRDAKAQRNIGPPIKPDWTCQAPVALEGDYLPIWDGAYEPTLPDVLWMVTNLMAGKRYIGLRLGNGFGLDRDGYVGFFKELASKISPLPPSCMPRSDIPERQNSNPQ